MNEEQVEKMKEAKKHSLLKIHYDFYVQQRCNECMGEVVEGGHCGGHKLNNGEECGLFRINTIEKRNLFNKSDMKKIVRKYCVECSTKEINCLTSTCALYKIRFGKEKRDE
jgi:hypothetical protein